jgi:Flp pilus assembly protein TadB
VHDAEFVIIIFALLILAGLAVIWMGMQSRRQIREMEHRERLAMIERGLAPPPETDPGGFEERFKPAQHTETAGELRARSAGIIMIGLGLAFMFMLTFAAGEPGVGIGVGGAFALIGAAFFVNAVILNRSRPQVPPSFPAPLRRSEPPKPPSDTASS